MQGEKVGRSGSLQIKKEMKDCDLLLHWRKVISRGIVQTKTKIQPKKPESKNARAAESSDDEEVLLSITKGTDHTLDSWILDCRCDCHMCYSRDLFDT